LKAFKVVPATAKDLDVLVRQRHMMFEEMKRPTEEEHKIGDESYRSWVRAGMRSGRLRCLLVRNSEGEAVAGGCVWLREIHPAPGRPAGLTPYLMSMYTEPAYRRKGLATLLLNEAMDWARRQGYARLSLHASEAGRKVYAKIGFERSWEMRVDLTKPTAGKKRPSTAARARSSRRAA
jgi:GNAT superfamily N-acetyltransferase